MMGGRSRALVWPASLLALASACSTLEGLGDLEIVDLSADASDARDAAVGEPEDAADASPVDDGAIDGALPSDDAGLDARGTETAPVEDAMPIVDSADTDAADATVLDDGAVDAGGADANESGADASDGSSDAAPADAGVDARVCTSLTVVQNDTLAGPQNTHWVLGENAFFTRTPPSTYYCELTSATPNIQGSLWWNDLFLFDAFDLTFSFLLSANGTYADGIGFGWIPQTTAVASPGFGGSTYGMAPLGGFGVVIDTYQNAGEPSPPFLTVVMNDATATHLVNAAVPPLLGGSTFHAMHIVFKAPNVSVTIDGSPVLTSFAIPNYVPFVGRWAFFAANGALYEQSLVTGITMTFPYGSCTP